MNTWSKEDDLEWISEPLWELSEKMHSHSLVTWTWMCVIWRCCSPSHHFEGNTYLRMKPPGEGFSERWTETGPWQYFWNVDPVILEARPMLVHISHRSQAISSPPLPLPPTHLPLLPPFSLFWIKPASLSLSSFCVFIIERVPSDIEMKENLLIMGNVSLTYPHIFIFICCT